MYNGFEIILLWLMHARCALKPVGTAKVGPLEICTHVSSPFLLICLFGERQKWPDLYRPGRGGWKIARVTQTVYRTPAGKTHALEILQRHTRYI